MDGGGSPGGAKIAIGHVISRVASEGERRGCRLEKRILIVLAAMRDLFGTLREPTAL